MRRRRRSLAKPFALLLLVVGAVLAGFWYYQPQQRPDWVTESLPIAPKSKVALYRWKNAKGEWVVSDQEPPAGTEFERVEIRNDVNVMPSNKN